MTRLDIDFAPPAWRRTVYRTSARSWLLAALALAACVACAVVGQRLVAQQRADSAELAAAFTRAKAPVLVAVTAPAPKITEQQAAVVNGAIMQLNLPWRALHDAIGAATLPNIAMLSLEPDPRKSSIKITAEAKTSDEMITYVESLKKQELFVDVLLMRHEVSEQDPNRPIRFQIEAVWGTP